MGVANRTLDALAVAPRMDWDAVDPSAHSVQFYDDDAFLIDAMTRFIGGGLGAGDVGIVIATPAHRDGLEQHLRTRGFDLAVAAEQGRYVALDAADTLAAFMVDGWPDEQRFAEVVGGALTRASAREHGRLRAFGEMVVLLWEQGKPQAAIRLEELWNDLARMLPFSLLCAYPMRAFQKETDGAGLAEICDAHRHVVPAESYLALGSPGERLRAITRLQQKAVALETEVVQRREAEAALRDRNQTLQALFAASPLPIVVIQADTTVRLWNPAAERVFGWSEQEVLGKPIPIVPPDKLTECAGVRERVLRGESILGAESSRLRRDGTTLDVSISAAPLTDHDGIIREIVLLFEDVTERNRLYTAERVARAEAEASSRAKDEFLAMLGHELRNPLSAVRNAVVTARLDSSRSERALDIARRQADHLGRLVDDLLDVARITQGLITLRRQRVRFASIVDHAIETTRPLIEERAHAICVTLPSSDVTVEADATRLEQVIVNLITNAAKYTEPGGHIEVSAEREGDAVVLRVRDDGSGIAPDVLPRIFDLFAQADRTLDRSQGGLGIGLTVARKLVELHEGRIEARSAGTGQGSEFIVTIPALPSLPVETAPARGRDADRGRARILVVEDNPDAAESLMMLLELLGHHVRIVNDGADAIDVASTDAPDVMLVDIGLPVVDGYEVARRVRAHPLLKHVVLVALTGYGREEDRQRALESGFDYHLVKPIDADALHRVVARVGSEKHRPTKRTTVH